MGKRAKHRRERSCDGKRRYRDQDEALAALRRFAKWSVRAKVPVRAYECHRCKGWHTTAQAEGYP